MVKLNNGLLHGYRSGLEEQVAKQLKDADVEVYYESDKIEYLKPARNAKYTPDFPLPNGIVIETKGRFLVADRQKHLLIKQQHPDIDIRFVFSSSRRCISKKSKTTYAAWCEKHGFQYADKYIPEAWLNEPTNSASLEALEAASPKKK